jgi:acetoin utilization deacetylase AcuC-like enzyme
MRASYHPDQALHHPQQFMRAGRIATPTDVPARTERLLGALGQLGVTPEAPSQQYDEARLAVHTPGFLRYLETAWDRWQQLSPRGPEVCPQHVSILEWTSGGSGAAPSVRPITSSPRQAGTSAICPCRVVQEGGYAVDVIGDCLCAFLGELA